MAIFGKLLGKSGPVDRVAANAGIEQAAGSKHFDAVTARQLGRMQRSPFHPISIIDRVSGASSTVVHQFAKYGKWAGMLAFVLPAAHKALAAGNFETLDEYNELRADVDAKKSGVAGVWQVARVKPHALLAGIENILQTVTFNRLSKGVQENGNLRKGVFSVLKESLKHSSAETLTLEALVKQKAEAEAANKTKINGTADTVVEKKEEALALSAALGGSVKGAYKSLTGGRSGAGNSGGAEQGAGEGVQQPTVSAYLRGSWSQLRDVSGMKDRMVAGLKDTSLLAGAVKVSQVTGTTVNLYNTAAGFGKNFKMLKLLHLQTTGQEISTFKILFRPKTLPDTVKLARREFVRSVGLGTLVNGLSMGISAYVLKKKLPSFSLTNPSTYIAGVGFLVNRYALPYVNGQTSMLTELQGLNYENPTAQDFAKKMYVLHPEIRRSSMAPDHPMLIKVGEHLVEQGTALSAVPRLLQSGWVDNAFKTLGQNATAATQGQDEPLRSPQLSQQRTTEQANMHTSREDARRNGAPARHVERPAGSHLGRESQRPAGDMALTGAGV